MLAFVDVMRSIGVDGSQLLAALGLREQLLEEPGTRVPLEQMNALVALGRERSGEPGIGIYMGLRRRLSSYGFLGLAAMHARTLRQALELAVEFAPTVSTAVSLRFEEDGQVASLRLIENGDLAPVRDVVLIAMVMGLARIGATLTGRELRGHVCMALPKPDYYERFADQLFDVRFDQPDTRIVFEASSLELPLVTPDNATLRLARDQCERALTELQQGASFVDCVRRLIVDARGFRTLEQVAERLHLSPRTLRRRLATYNVSFADLIDGERRKQAQFLLRSSERELSWICEQLGYATLPNFVRAFKRWTGTTPAAYRRGLRTT
ncbi:MAG TPA: AraC family transcriptional regulator [Polyangiales bacterium]|nr:AraC family transcriptional regulator [Polyangiales bacterium]